MSSRCLYCAEEIPAGETIRMVTRYSCGKCWMREDVDRLLADCRAVLERAAEYCGEDVIDEIDALLSRLPER